MAGYDSLDWLTYRALLDCQGNSAFKVRGLDLTEALSDDGERHVDVTVSYRGKDMGPADMLDIERSIRQWLGDRATYSFTFRKAKRPRKTAGIPSAS